EGLMRRAVVTRRSNDTGGAVLRSGERELATLGSLRADDDGTMASTFTHRPAFADVADEMRRLAAASGDEALAIAAEIDRAGVHVWHSVHNMRIDRPGSIRLVKGEIRFAPTDAFLVMRSGGLG
ncbi:MAG TPA: hypothetical protein PK264_09770, partial [Hyphomicrobiaceae bacterium]|nr:hypothetical protein [Hyphomicrobiaceae bacterium]